MSVIHITLPRAFQSTPPARGATVNMPRSDLDAGISIHAPREGGDPAELQNKPYKVISIHAPREGGD